MVAKMSIRDSRFGYKEVMPKPSPNELKTYYEEKYYQQNKGAYSPSYSMDEKRYFRNKIEQRYRIVSELLGEERDHAIRFLDVGAGEGWALAFFHELGWECLGVDFSDHGCRRHNPEMCKHLCIGDIFDTLKELESTTRFDVVWLDNVLEHVPDPARLLEDIRRLTSFPGILVVEVPNDFSRVQEFLLDSGYISRPFWVTTPDHLSYFNKEGLAALAEFAGWHLEQIIGDFPIDFNLFNSDTNYVEDPSRGKRCHQARVAIENLIHEVSPDGANRLYQVLGELGLGRGIVAFLKPASAVPPRNI